VVYITGRAPKTHETCAIAVANEELTVERHHQLLHTISQYIVQEVQLQVRFFALHPHGVGIKLRTPVQRDTLLALNPYFISFSQITFYLHDEAPMNFRRMTFSRKCWLLLLGYPLDFKDLSILSQACAPFAKVLYWNSEDPSLSRVLLKVLVEDPLEVPRSLVIKIGKESDGDGRSWTVPVYVFNSDMVNAGPTNKEDPPANNGDPHPFHGPVVPGEPDFVAHIADQFINNLPQQVTNLQVPDQGSQNNSVVAQEDSATAPLFT
jgi:hypothetical protein